MMKYICFCLTKDAKSLTLFLKHKTTEIVLHKRTGAKRFT